MASNFSKLPYPFEPSITASLKDFSQTPTLHASMARNGVMLIRSARMGDHYIVRRDVFERIVHRLEDLGCSFEKDFMDA